MLVFLFVVFSLHVEVGVTWIDVHLRCLLDVLFQRRNSIAALRIVWRFDVRQNLGLLLLRHGRLPTFDGDSAVAELAVLLAGLHSSFLLPLVLWMLDHLIIKELQETVQLSLVFIFEQLLRIHVLSLCEA